MNHYAAVTAYSSYIWNIVECMTGKLWGEKLADDVELEKICAISPFCTGNSISFATKQFYSGEVVESDHQ